MNFTPHTGDDLAAMLEAIGLPDLDALFEHIPLSLRVQPGVLADLPEGRSEDEVLGELSGLAGRNNVSATCFAGGGAYDHYVPAVISALTGRGEFLTAYTPYQPEMSQGMLQALFEYQTVVSELSGLEVSNASLYDGGSAVAEAMSLACAATRRSAIVVSQALDLPSRQVLGTYAHPRSIAVRELAYDATTGRTPVPQLADDVQGDVAALVVAQPNCLGVIEDLRAHAEAAHAAGAKLIVKLDPLAVGLLATPGSQGADIVVGEGQSLGQGLTYGGPTFGFFACDRDQVRRLPGRVVGETVDTRGTRGYVMTLRAREQDIRRERATSNICTNQTLNAVAGLIYLTWLGPQGLTDLARGCLARAQHAAARLSAVDGVQLAVDGPFYKEFCLRLDVPDPAAVVRDLHAGGYLVGPVVADGPAAGGVLVAVTERRTAAEVEGLASALEAAVRDHRLVTAGRS